MKHEHESFSLLCLRKDSPRIFGKPLIAACALLISLAGCGGGTGSSSGSAGSDGVAVPPDVTAPTVTAMTPGEDTFGAGTNSQLTVTFSEAMNPADFTTANFRLTDGTNAIPGTVSYDITNRIAVFSPTGGLAPRARYTATIITGIKDLGENPLTTDFAWCFTTDASTDNTAPGVIATNPVNGAMGIAVNRKITAIFNEDMNSATLTPANFTVTGPGTTPVPGTVTYRAGTAVFQPTPGLASNTTYTATIGTGVRDVAGNAMPANVTWGFTTGAIADVVAPVVMATNPVNAESGVGIGRTINVSLSEPMDPATITTANFFVTGPGASLVIGTVAFDAGTNTAIFTRINHLTTPVAFHPIPVTNLEPNTTYTATFTTGARDLAGNALANNRVWSFTTAP